MGAGHDRRARLGGAGAGDIRGVAALLALDRGLALRRHHVPVALRPRPRGAGAHGVSVGAALYRHGRRAGADLARSAAHRTAPPGDVGTRVQRDRLMDLNSVDTVLLPRARAELPPWSNDTALLGGGTWLFSEPQPEIRRLVDLTA